MSEQEAPFLGLPDDIARLAVQRFMTCDLRFRSHKRRANHWQAIGLWISVGVAVLSSVAALSYVQDVEWLAVPLSILVAVLVPLQSALSAPGRSNSHRDAATRYELLANDLERFLQLDLGPPMWRAFVGSFDHLRDKMQRLDTRVSEVTSNAPPISFRDAEKSAVEVRAKNLVEYLQMTNVEVPDRLVWVH